MHSGNNSTDTRTFTQKYHLTGALAQQKQTLHDGRSLRKKKGEGFEAFVEVSRVLRDVFQAKAEYPRQHTTVDESDFPYVTTGVLVVSLHPAALVFCTTLIWLSFSRHQDPWSFIQDSPHLFAEGAFIGGSGSASQGPSRLICIRHSTGGRHRMRSRRGR